MCGARARRREMRTGRPAHTWLCPCVRVCGHTCACPMGVSVCVSVCVSHACPCVPCVSVSVSVCGRAARVPRRNLGAPPAARARLRLRFPARFFPSLRPSLPCAPPLQERGFSLPRSPFRPGGSYRALFSEAALPLSVRARRERDALVPPPFPLRAPRARGSLGVLRGHPGIWLPPWPLCALLAADAEGKGSKALPDGCHRAPGISRQGQGLVFSENK